MWAACPRVRLHDCISHITDAILTDCDVVRAFALAATLIATVYFLFQSFHTRSGLTSTTTSSLHKISEYVPSRWARAKPPRITKVTSNLNGNDLFESALGTHEAHNSFHGYDLRVLRERIADGWSNQAAYLLSIIVNELEKPKKQRTEWLLWFQPDVIVLNPQIPLEIFLPPEPEFNNVHFLATHDNQDELDSGVFFLRVHEWSAKMLLEVISMPAWTPGLEQARRKDRWALSKVVKSDTFRDSVYYQPRHWYNAYAVSANSSEYRQGDMQLHFHGLGGDKWRGLANTLELLSSTPSDFSVPLSKTTLPAEADAYWNRIAVAQRTLKKAEGRLNEEGLEARFQRLGYATNYEADKEQVMQEAIDGLRDAMGVSNGEHAI